MIAVEKSESEIQDSRPTKRQRHFAATADIRGVIIWDIDDTLIIALNSAMVLLASGNGANADTSLVSNIEEYFLEFLDDDLHFSDVHHWKPVEHIREWENLSFLESCIQDSSLSSLNEDNSNNPKPTSSYTPQTYAAFLREKYTKCHNRKIMESDSTLEKSCSSEGLWENDEKYVRWKEALVAMDALSDNWTQKARIVLRHLNSNGCRNIVVTASEIIPAYAKLLLWELSEFFDYNDVYSSVHRPKSAIFLQILEDLGRSGCKPKSMASCGDGPSEEVAARTFSIPFQRISTSNDLFLVPRLLGEDLDLPIPSDFVTPVETKDSSESV